MSKLVLLRSMKASALGVVNALWHAPTALWDTTRATTIQSNVTFAPIVELQE